MIKKENIQSFMFFELKASQLVFYLLTAKEGNYASI